MKVLFSSHANHISSAPKPHVASGCCAGQCRHEICPSSQGMCRLNARPTLSRFLGKQTTQNTFLQINNITLSKTLKEMRRPSLQSPGRRENSATSTGCEIYQEWGEAIKICRTKHRGYKHIHKPLSNLFLMNFFAKFLILLSPWPLLNTERLWMGNQGVVSSILIFFLFGKSHTQAKGFWPKNTVGKFQFSQKINGPAKMSHAISPCPLNAWGRKTAMKSGAQHSTLPSAMKEPWGLWPWAGHMTLCRLDFLSTRWEVRKIETFQSDTKFKNSIIIPRGNPGGERQKHST